MTSTVFHFTLNLGLGFLFQKPETTAPNAAKQPETTAEPVTSGTNNEENRNSDGANSAPNNAPNDNNNVNATEVAAASPEQTTTFTAEQDAKLLEMKADGKSTWKQIAAELGKPPHELKARFKELKAAENAAGGDSGGQKEVGGGGGEGGGNGGNGDGATWSGGGGGGDGEGGGGNNGGSVKEEGGKREKGGKGKKNKRGYAAAPAGDGRSELVSGESQWKKWSQDELFSFEELQILSELVRKDKEREWLRIASGFYDKTGRRVHADDVQERFAEL
ncbi:hypothetical protein EV356DRAFT_568246 [Viridothelium virens]|uniref:Myb-like domain-containing protein n=1 Tax=Viridothelium virens TaxID=1048519 RepID=A0A6A6H594_VIRVR|nr:hypothetical protein EV356DRAFT_568246 [Viridothelium virens]